MNNYFTSMTATRIQLLKREIDDLKKTIEQSDKSMRALKTRKFELEKSLQVQQKRQVGLKNCKNFVQMKLICKKK